MKKLSTLEQLYYSQPTFDSNLTSNEGLPHNINIKCEEKLQTFDCKLVVNKEQPHTRVALTEEFYLNCDQVRGDGLFLIHKKHE